MRRSNLLPLLAALALPVAPAPLPAAPPGAVDLNRVVAVVNDDVILQTELERRTRAVAARLQRKGTDLPPPEVLRRQVLEQLILERIQLQLAAKAGIQVDDAMLGKALARIAEQNRMSVADFRRVLERDGYDYGAFREEIRTELAVSELRRRQVENRIQVSDREIDNTLVTASSQAGAQDEYRLTQVVVALEDSASERQVAAARARAEALREDLRQGTDPARAVSGGDAGGRAEDLGWRRLEQLPGPIADAVLRLKRGEVSDVVRTADGFHVLKLQEVRRGPAVLVGQTRARHIALRETPGADENAVRERLKQLRRRVLAGEDFASLARSHSADAPSASRGGDLGWLNPGDVSPAFERAMGELQPGGVSEPFRTQFGWHIVQVLERRQHDSTDEMRRARARQAVRERKVEAETEAWLRRLRDEAYVEIRLPE
jgi:peptidyl-prolyl cis-trans isomerase SurA